MAGASDPLEDMLFSEVDEKAVSDLVGSLESQLVGRSGNKTGIAKQHIGKPLTSTSEQQQHHQHQQQHKTGTERGSDPVQITPSSGAASPESCVKASTSGSRSHSSSSSLSPSSSSSPSSSAKTSGVCAQDGATSPAVSVSPAGRRAAAASASMETPRHYGTRKKRGVARGSTASRSVNGAATSSVSSTSLSSAGAAVSMAMARTNSSTYTVSSASRSVALDKGTPMIALHRLPSHIVASIAQGRNGTSVSALIQPGRVNHGKNAESAEDKTKADVRQVLTGSVNSVSSTVHITSPVSVQATRVVPAVQNRVVQSAPQTCTSSSTTTSSFTTTTTASTASTTSATTTSPAVTVRTFSLYSSLRLSLFFSIFVASLSSLISVCKHLPERAPLAVTTPQQHPAALAPQGPTLTPPTPAGPAPGATVISQDAKIEPEEFTSRLQTELKSQPYLVPFLKKSLPALRLSLLSSQQSLIQPPQPKPIASPTVAGAVTTGNAPRQPNSTVTPPQNIKRTGTIGGQVRMPVVITQTMRTAGGVAKSPVVQTGKSPAAVSVQLSGAQKNKVNDPGGGSFRDDDDINDVASMAGVNLNEESARILATNSELVGTQIRSCKDEAFLPTGLLHRRILETAKKFGVTDVHLEAVNFIAHATQTRLRTVLEKVSFIAQHRMDSCKDEEWLEQSSDVRSQLKFFEHLERLEKQRKDEQEREILLKAAKMQQQELAQMRQRDANLTALAAIGPRKKRKVDSPGATTGTEVRERTNEKFF
ncbi:Transcription initiation factor TFIID subunit 4 [Bagarius yarrelli]|uniref:Transcription initiation factor TFIID subunit 4 n=1 Tax=Bagarius yarrelli TaxID=175774 RepID=A0A556TQK1_BAGYA|nr:Transcription initiation factor TFIID subunit 4 [Bagarius yarrelli]